MKQLYKYFKPYLFVLVILIGFTYGQSIINLTLPDLTADIINKGIIGNNNSLVYKTGLEMLLITLIGGAITVVIGYLGARVATGFSRRLRAAVFAKIESFSLAEFDTFSSASLITRSTNDIQQIQSVLLVLLRVALLAPIMGIGAVIKAYALAPSMTWIMLAAVLAIVALITVLFIFAVPKFKLLQKLVDKLNLVSRESLTGLRVIRAFNREKYEEKKFDQTNKDLTGVNLAVNRLMVILQPTIMLVMSFASIAVVWVGAYRIGSGELLVGDMLAFMQYAILAITSFLMISIIFILVPRAAVSVSRVAEVLSTESVILDPENPKSLFGLKNGVVIDFNNVSFKYPEADGYAVNNVSFRAEPGQTTAIIGSTGSGKTTLINLIPRFYDVAKGSIKINGVNIKDISQHDLMKHIGFVPQKATLFSGTVKSNILYGRAKASDEDVQHAAIVAQADSFVSKMDLGYDSSVAQGGGNLSGGQKQRLGIARALAKKPQIYIFDQSFSALDLKTDSQLRKALKPETKGKTVIIVAQRVSTIIDADKILVIDDGRIVGRGTHADLLEDSKEYREIAISQLSKEEILGGIDNAGRAKRIGMLLENGVSS
ncbi:MAG: ABC transporter ATP-binding protein [Candidatus Saccharimonas sp.]